MPWHEDSAYWRGYMEPMEVVTVWLAIDPSTRENGCMMVIPRTQGNGFSDYEPVDKTKNVFDTEIIRPQRDMSRAVAIELQPNQASLHDGKLQHGSEANTSPLRRCGYTMRYISTRTRSTTQRSAISRRSSWRAARPRRQYLRRPDPRPIWKWRAPAPNT